MRKLQLIRGELLLCAAFLIAYLITDSLACLIVSLSAAAVLAFVPLADWHANPAKRRFSKTP
jgi:hypothetical protein